MCLDSPTVRRPKASPIVAEGIALGCDNLAGYALRGHSKRAFGVPFQGEFCSVRGTGGAAPGYNGSGLRPTEGGSDRLGMGSGEP